MEHSDDFIKPDDENTELEPGAVVFMRTGDLDSDSAGDIWDDSALIKAYDRAIKQAQQGSSNSKQKKGKKKNKNKRKPTAQKPSGQQWTVGDYCRAYYTEDSQLYDALIIEILDDERCVVQYTEYGNEEEQLLTDLRQIKPQERRTSHSRTQSITSGEHSLTAPSPRQDRDNFQGHSHPFRQPPMVPGLSSFVPPPPPSLPDMAPCDTEEAFHSMLISWYMSGFHTGYYQGLKDGRQAHRDL